MVSNINMISGLASGMDTETMVKDLMRVRRMPLDKLFQNRQVLKWQQEDFRDINIKLRSFRDKAFSMKLQGTYLASRVNSSNENVVKATANSSATEGTYTITVDRLARGAYLTSGEIGSAEDKTSLNTQLNLSGSQQLKINGETITVDSTESINSLISKINSFKKADGSALGVKASYDAKLDRVFLMTEKTGSDQSITVENSTLSKALKITTSDDPLVAATTAQGVDAQFDLNGVSDLTMASNSFTISGVTYNLQGVSGTQVTVTVTRDTDAVFNAIKDFINSYNETINSVNEKLGETRYKDYLPLTDEQKEDMSDKEIEKWEEFSRSGLLRKDAIIGGNISAMRSTMMSVVPGLDNGSKYNTLASIGITSGLYSEKGKLYINETKLKEALQKDMQAVADLFTKDDSQYGNKGIAMRLYDDVNKTMTQISAKAGSSDGFSLVDNSVIGKQLSRIDERSDDLKDRLLKIEERYWKQFTAMEKSISQLNSQSSWLAQQFSSGQ